MHIARHVFIFILTGLIISSCALKDLKDDLAAAEQEYGYFKGQATGPGDGSNVLIGLYKREQDGMSIANMRTVSSGESFYMLAIKADYSVLAFADLNGDFVYQPGEPAAHVRRHSPPRSGWWRRPW